MSVLLRILFALLCVKGFVFEKSHRCRLPDGITKFEFLRDRNFCYVDKTDFIWKMLETQLIFYFIARPRKFGKSLFCRTVESALWGHKQFFHDLAISKSTYDWAVHPVIYLDFSTIGLESETSCYYAKTIVDELQSIPDRILTERGSQIKDTSVRIHADSNNTDVCRSLKSLVYSLKKAFSSTVGLVIDEYDAVITENLGRPQVVEALCKTLRRFYSCVKGLENDFRFVFITGIARFTQSYMFSSMNNLNDISLNDEYADALGFTETEMKHFDPEIAEIVEYKNKKRGENITTKDVEIKLLHDNFNGYRFTQGGPSVYHPAFLMTYLRTKYVDSYRAKSPEPKYIFDLLPQRLHTGTIDLLKAGINATEDDLRGVTDPKNIKLSSLLFQSGIFTIKEYYHHTNTYFLNYSNLYTKEHIEGRIFEELMKPEDSTLDYRSFTDKCDTMMNDLLIGDEEHVKSYFHQLDILATQKGYHTFPRKPAGMEEEGGEEPPKTTKRGPGRPPKRPKKTKQDFYFALEGAFQYMIEICLDVTKVGRVSSEKVLSAGRADIVFEIPKRSKTIVYETKAGVGDVKEALNQFLTLYAKAYLNNIVNLICIAVSFSKETRSIEDWIYAEYNEKGELLNFFSRKGHNASTMELHDISLT